MTSSRHRPEVLCACCEQIGRHNGRRLCEGCHRTHRLAGTLHQFPRTNSSISKLGRLDDFAELRQHGNTIRAAAEQLGISQRTGERYAALHASRQPERTPA